MALTSQATLTPPKLEPLNAWLPTHPWAGSDAVRRLAAHRFDEPDGRETLTGRWATGEAVVAPVTRTGAGS